MSQLDRLEAGLLSAAASADVVGELALLAEELRELGVGVAAIRPILKFMEAHPHIDLGAPGPLVHFVEQFFGAGYETELLASLGRRPTAHTVWMLNRVINGTKTSAALETMIVGLRAVEQHPAADAEARLQAAGFLERLGR